MLSEVARLMMRLVSLLLKRAVRIMALLIGVKCLSTPLVGVRVGLLPTAVGSTYIGSTKDGRLCRESGRMATANSVVSSTAISWTAVWAV